MRNATQWVLERNLEPRCDKHPHIPSPMLLNSEFARYECQTCPRFFDVDLGYHYRTKDGRATDFNRRADAWCLACTDTENDYTV
jgi:hypothetical protein